MKNGLWFGVTMAIFVAMLVAVAAGCKDSGSTGSSLHGAGADSTQVARAACPVSGDPADPKVFIEYEGKKVYFCCSMCIGDFKADPAKYLGEQKALDHAQASKSGV